jgi:hypothetical protein
VIDDWLQLDVARPGATLNDVEVHGSTVLHAGDLIAEGDLQYLVLPRPALVAYPHDVLDHWSWRRRLTEEVGAGRNSFTVLIGRSGAFGNEFLGSALTDFASPAGARHIVGTVGRNVLEVLVIGDPSGADAFRQFLSDRAAAEEETVRWGMAGFPRHGATAEELWAVAIERLLGLTPPEAGELVWSDPCMSRLRALADRWSRRHALSFIGAEGAGRESLARLVRASSAPATPFVVHLGARFDGVRWNEDVARAVGGSLHVRRPDILPEAERRAFWNARNFRPSIGMSADQTIGLPDDRIVVPDLSSRPGDVGPIAELVLHAVDAQLGRRRSSLRAETRSLLQTLPSPENVRTLRNLVIRGALNATSGEVRVEHLDLPSAMQALSGVRAKVRETERREIESALHSSNWNVTEAARRMELPRRTLVYRMGRLGLRRPSGSR